MKLVELFEETALDYPSDFILRNISNWERREDLGDGDVTSSIDIDDIDKAKRYFKSEIHDGKITIYRAMILNNSNLRRLSEGCGLGQCWSCDKSLAKPYNGNESKYELYIFTATVSEDDVDWMASIALFNMGEQEIRLKHGVSIILEKIEDYGGFVIKRELIGKIFFATR